MPGEKPFLGVRFTRPYLVEQVFRVGGVGCKPVHNVPCSSNSQTKAEIDTKTWKMTKKVRPPATSWRLRIRGQRPNRRPPSFAQDGEVNDRYDLTPKRVQRRSSI